MLAEIDAMEEDDSVLVLLVDVLARSVDICYVSNVSTFSHAFPLV